MTDLNLGYLVSESIVPSAADARMCDCPGARVFEMLDEPPLLDKFWHVCACCGKRVLLNPISEDTP